MAYKTGARLYSQVDTTEVVLVRPPADSAIIACGGHPMTDTKVPSDELRAAVEEPGSGLLIGKRYTVEDSPAELLVTKPGSYGITIDGRAVAVKEAKPLPASD